MSIDVRCLPYMPLHIERLRRSKAWLRCKRRPELAFYLMNLWMRAWHEVPAGSIEADDDVLADAAMCSPEEWERIRSDVLHGWEERDGRWHHHVVTELAAEILASRRLSALMGAPPLADRTPIPSETRRYVFARDGELCKYCGDFDGPFHIDHVVPWSRGGTHDPDNLRVACAKCNLSKSDRTPQEMGWWQ